MNGDCLAHCRFEAILTRQEASVGNKFFVDPIACEGCGVCVQFCPVKAIDFPDRLCGEWFVSATRVGPLVHAKLSIAAENSGKLVSTVRQSARRLAESETRALVIVDGPPGIGCPVIASITGATQVLVVTEPTVTGEHDLERVLERHLRKRSDIGYAQYLRLREALRPGNLPQERVLSAPSFLSRHGAAWPEAVRAAADVWASRLEAVPTAG